MRMVESCRDVLNKKVMISQKTDTDELTETVRIMTATQNCSFSCWYVVVARSTFPSQNVKNTRGADHFWHLRCRKSARRCGAKHISSQNVQNTPFSDHFWKLRCRKSACRCGPKHISKSTCSKNTRGSDHFWRFRCRFASLHYITLHYTPLHYRT